MKTMSILAVVCCAAGVHAQVVDFEDLGVAFGTQLNPAAGVGVVSQGFEYIPGPNNSSGLNDLHIAWDDGIWSSNGTTVGGTHDDVILSMVGGGVFDVLAFDFAGFPTDAEVPFTVTASNGAFAVFTPDGIVDGTGGAADFQTFSLSSAFSGVTWVKWEHTGNGTISGLFALDNIVTRVPTPGSMAIAGLVAYAVGGRRR